MPATVAIGTAVSLSVGLVLRENPPRQISRMGHALDSRLALVLDVVADGLAASAWTSWHHRRLARRVGQVHDTVLMIGGQLHDLDEHDLPGGIDRDTLVRRLFDVELSVEYLSAAWQRAADGGSGPGHDADPQPETRSRLRDAVVALRTGLRAPDRAGALAKARTIAVDVGAVPAISPRWQSLAHWVSSLSHAIANLRAPEPDPASDQATTDGQPQAADEVHADNTALHGTQPDDTAPDQSQTRTADGSPAADQMTGPRLSPNTRQVVQVTVAGALAIVVGQLLSPSRWHWALITTFLIYFGTRTTGQTLTKGWQRIVGTVIGVGIGTLIASLVGGNVAASPALIFVAIFTGFYIGKMSYAVLSTCITSMLALLYGLFGEFTIGLLLTRIEETAIGAAIGIAAAFLILPTRTITAARASIRSFLQRLADLVAMAGQQLSGQGHDDLLGAAWVLDQQLAAVRTRIDPLTKAITGLRSSSRASWALNLLDICDHAGRGLARVAAPVGDQAAGHALEHAARRIHDNIGLLVDAID
jgi:uncharacterized membrane protein YccC